MDSHGRHDETISTHLHSYSSSGRGVNNSGGSNNSPGPHGSSCQSQESVFYSNNQPIIKQGKSSVGDGAFNIINNEHQYNSNNNSAYQQSNTGCHDSINSNYINITFNNGSYKEEDASGSSVSNNNSTASVNTVGPNNFSGYSPQGANNSPNIRATVVIKRKMEKEDELALAESSPTKKAAFLVQQFLCQNGEIGQGTNRATPSPPRERDFSSDGAISDSSGSISPDNKSKSKKRSCTRWTEEENKLLVEAVEKYGGKNWSEIAKFVGNKTSDQCNQHWHRVLNPAISKKPWTQSEDKMLIDRVNEFGESSWKKISQAISRRTDLQCRHRWTQIKKSMSPKEPKPPKTGKTSTSQRRGSNTNLNFPNLNNPPFALRDEPSPGSAGSPAAGSPTPPIGLLQQFHLSESNPDSPSPGSLPAQAHPPQPLQQHHGYMPSPYADRPPYYSDHSQQFMVLEHDHMHPMMYMNMHSSGHSDLHYPSMSSYQQHHMEQTHHGYNNNTHHMNSSLTKDEDNINDLMSGMYMSSMFNSTPVFQQHHMASLPLPPPQRGGGLQYSPPSHHHGHHGMSGGGPQVHTSAHATFLSQLIPDYSYPPSQEDPHTPHSGGIADVIRDSHLPYGSDYLSPIGHPSPQHSTDAHSALSVAGGSSTPTVTNTNTNSFSSSFHHHPLVGGSHNNSIHSELGLSSDQDTPGDKSPL